MRSPSQKRPEPLALAIAALLSVSCGATRAPDANADAPEVAAAAVAPAAPALPHCELTWPIAELEDAELSIGERCGVEGARWFPLGGPRGMRWDIADSRVAYGPDWLEGGRSYTVELEAWRGGERVATGALRVEVADVVRPPPLRIDREERVEGGRLIEATLVTDAFLDAPGYAGREVAVRVAVPDTDGPSDTRPVELMLHGFDGQPDVAVDRSFHVAVHDPDNTYWWGYDAALPAGTPTGESVPDYTLRKALWALEWTLNTFESADRDRVYVHGSSMGGTGAATVGLFYPRHFAWISAHIGQTIARNHRPRRLEQLQGWYGPVDAQDEASEGSVWDALDLTRVLRDDPAARDTFLFLRHGKDDTIIHFGAVVQPSPLTGLSFYDALQAFGVGHYAVWDESGHGTADPTLPARWWHSGWHPMTDATTRLALDAAFPAFSSASHDGDTGGFDGVGAFDTSRGYAGDWRVAGDTRWAGDRAGALNRGLRWDSEALVDTVPRFALPLRLHAGTGAPAPSEGEPCLYDQTCATLPVVVNVTLRRVQAFRLAPGEQAEWTFGARTGIVSAAGDGTLTLEGLPLTEAWTTLELRRIPQ